MLIPQVLCIDRSEDESGDRNTEALQRLEDGDSHGDPTTERVCAIDLRRRQSIDL